jgi:hypothetical protein
VPNLGIQKTVVLVLALVKLLNFCTDADDSVVLPSTASDAWDMR